MSRYYSYETIRANAKDVTLANGAKYRCIDPDALLDIEPADVVEADKAQKEIDYWHDKAQSYEQTILKLSLNKADVVEVVRCKDCKWRSKKWYQDKRRKAGGYYSIGCNNDYIAERVYGLAGDDDYCSYGEREEA